MDKLCLKTVVFILTLVSSLALFAADHPKELFFQKIAEKTLHGHSSQLSDGTICDILTPDYAVEVDFAHKWYEAVGQSLHYALVSKRKPGIVLIILKKSDLKFLGRLLKVNKAYKLDIRIWIIKRLGSTIPFQYICELIYPLTKLIKNFK